MTQLGVTVKNNADNARQAGQLAVSVRDVANKGNEATTAITGTMKSISESSGRIAEITAVIDGIAFQTNILALKRRSGKRPVPASTAGDLRWWQARSGHWHREALRLRVRFGS